MSVSSYMYTHAHMQYYAHSSAPTRMHTLQLIICNYVCTKINQHYSQNTCRNRLQWCIPGSYKV